MKINLEKGEIRFAGFVKLFTIAWGFGIGSFALLAVIVDAVRLVVTGNSELLGDSLVNYALIPFMVFGQGVVFGMIGYVGIVIYRKFFKLTFEDNDT